MNAADRARITSIANGIRRSRSYRAAFLKGAANPGFALDTALPDMSDSDPVEVIAS
jgi:hypothetical protein